MRAMRGVACCEGWQAALTPKKKTEEEREPGPAFCWSCSICRFRILRSDNRISNCGLFSFGTTGIGLESFANDNAVRAQAMI
jgi:hypothetical protein